MSYAFEKKILDNVFEKEKKSPRVSWFSTAIRKHCESRVIIQCLSCLVPEFPFMV